MSSSSASFSISGDSSVGDSLKIGLRLLGVMISDLVISTRALLSLLESFFNELLLGGGGGGRGFDEAFRVGLASSVKVVRK